MTEEDAKATLRVKFAWICETQMCRVLRYLAHEGPDDHSLEGCPGCTATSKVLAE